MKNFFKPEDFFAAIQYSNGAEECKKKIATIANNKLQELIDASPVVYGSNQASTWTKETWKTDTNKARLMFIEPIVKRECTHEPSVETCIIRGDGLLKEFSTSGKCRHCGVKLKAKWEPVK